MWACDSSVPEPADPQQKATLSNHFTPSAGPAQQWFLSGRERVTRKSNLPGLPDSAGKAKNIILFVGDGMGVSTVTAARIYAGQREGMTGEEFELAFDRFPFSGLSRTYNTDQQTPDSAGTMTAMVTGVKTRAGVLSISEEAQRGDCAAGEGRELFSVLELAELAGKATGVVTTARVTHATPAATYAKSVERDWEDHTKMPQEAVEQGCEDIASQLVSFNSRLAKRTGLPREDLNGIEVVLGGGLRHFLSEADGGQRTDGRNLLTEWQQQNAGGTVLRDRAHLENLPVGDAPVLGLFSDSHMLYGADNSASQHQQPTLAEMTAVALERLAENPRGFLLIVEAGRIDHAHHAGNAFNALSDTIALSDAVALAAERTSAEDTLIVVTADHSHVFTMAGYPARGNPILGKVRNTEGEPALDAEGNPYTTLGYMNGRGHAQYHEQTDADRRYQDPVNAGRADLSGTDTTLPGYHQESLVGLESETHGGEDVAIYARGPGAWLLSGSLEQHVIFHVIDRVGELSGRAELGLESAAKR